MITSSKEYKKKLRNELIHTLPKIILINSRYGVTATGYVDFIKKKWVIKYICFYGNKCVEKVIHTKSKYLIKAVWKAHKKIDKIRLS